MKEVIDRQEHDLETQKTESKMQINRLNDQAKNLEAEIRHQKHIREIEIKDLRNNLQAELTN